MSMYKQLRNVGAITLSLLIISCGGGGGDGDSGNSTDIPNDAINGPSEDIVNVPSDDINNGPTDDIVDAPIDDVIESPPGNTSNDPVTGLLGSVNLNYSFSSGEPVGAFLTTMDFGPESVIETESGAIVLVGPSTTFRFTADQTAQFEGPQTIACIALDDTGLIACFADADGPLNSVFVFNDIVAGNSQGEWVFCGPDISDDECADLFANSPSGSLSVSVSALATASLPSDDTIAMTSSDLSAYFQYDAQGTSPRIDIDEKNAFATPGMATQLADKRVEIKAALQ